MSDSQDLLAQFAQCLEELAALLEPEEQAQAEALLARLRRLRDEPEDGS